MFSHFSLHRLLVKAVRELNYRQPTPVQAETIPLALEGHDLQVNSETGSGKTLAYLLPSLNQLLDRSSQGRETRVLVLLPTRELAKQVFVSCQALIKHTNLSVVLVSGGDDFEHQAEQLLQSPAIVIATTGRLLEHIEKGTVDLSQLAVLVLDEADRMLDMGFSTDVYAITAVCNPNRQTLLFSATLNNKWLPNLAKKLLREPEVLTISGGRQAHAHIREQVLLADDDDHKQKQLLWLLANEKFDKAIVFCNSRERSEKLAAAIIPRRKLVGILHGEIEQRKRSSVMQSLQEGKINVLITTDVSARGLDIEGVDLVVNFDMPRRGDDYVHRIGRTGRGGKEGQAITLVKSTEWNLKASVERYLNHKFEPRLIEELKGSYSGPKKLRASGQAEGSKKKKNKKKGATKKAKQRKRDKQSGGKKHTPSDNKD